MNCDQLEHSLIEYLTANTRVLSNEHACRVETPLREVNGDAVNIFVEERDGRLMVHDGGHIAGTFFEAGPAGASAADKRLLDNLVKESSLEVDSNNGIVFAMAETSSLNYWMFEVARTVLIASSAIPAAAPRRRRRRRLGPRIAQQIVERLMAEGMMSVIKPGMNVRGVTEQERYVDLSYTIAADPRRQEADTTVFILAMDLDVANPIAKANHGLVVATDLSRAAIGNNQIDVRIVHSVGTANGHSERAKKLIQVAAGKHLLTDYSWDDPEDQARFLRRVGQEVSPLVSA